jgi:hypothetical protein
MKATPSPSISRSLRSAYQTFPKRSQQILHRRIAVTQCRNYSSESGKPGDELKEGQGSKFQSQLWDSTYQRIQRERADRVRYGQMQEAGEGRRLITAFIGTLKASQNSTKFVV